MRATLAWLVAVAALLSLTACGGDVSKDEFNAMVRARGGGIAVELPKQATAALLARLGVTDVMVRSVQLATPDPTMTFEVRSPTRPGDLDTYHYADRALAEPAPVKLRAGDDLAGQTFSLAGVTALNRIEDIVDLARTRVGLPDSWVEDVDIRKVDNVVTVTAIVSSARGAGTATFTADGTYLTSGRS
ncbi:hypothetical protein F0L68_00635 [Solihabitans fulvus]|uniref:Lipoprotein n=1 Tax=Solihabitans fulvus TaxID=1892852 RepID=A0A5B2XUU7_9PSEU|nr:hypothetical protein [Solihabitans fulvus]KAA2267073.1 hypothetical protein F0L68_00635 [Solihabitans fulvus]